MFHFLFPAPVSSAPRSTKPTACSKLFWKRWLKRAGCVSALAAGLLAAVPLQVSRAAEPNQFPTPARQPADVDLLIALLNEDARVRLNALERIAWVELRDERTLAAVAVCLHDPQPEVQAYAARTLWELDPSSAGLAVNTLEELLDSALPGVRPLAAFLLGDIGPEATSALPTLKRALQNTASTEQLQIAEAVARICPHDPDAVTVLMGGLQDPESGVRFQAAYALGEVSPVHAERVIPALAIAMGDQSPQVQHAAKLAMSRIPPKPLSEIREEASPPENSFASEPEETRGEASPPENSFASEPEPAQATDKDTTGVVLLEPEPMVPAFEEPADDPVESEPEERKAGTTQAEEPEENDLGLGEDYKPIRAVNVSITPKRRDVEGEVLTLPTNYGAAWLETQGAQAHPIGESRPWTVQPAQYAASAFCHQPLYFEEINLERYGHNFGHVLQPFVSAGAFFGRVPLLPYMIAAEHPHECQYTLGHYRSGSCAPYQCHRLPWSTRGALLEAGIITGLFFAIY